ncbi:MAG: hypothetical protein A2Z14_16650 [Chloroflexi bacterium RBG_16_48_8]|nr:MAG: hypothetical protein A2Z14_16650 [Chloroflexi bacterium RBG_16_48_8]
MVRIIDRDFIPLSRDLIGAGGQERFTFEPKMEGETSIRMQMKRPWEENPVAEQIFLLKILNE